MHDSEVELKTLMAASLAVDGRAHRVLLEKLSRYLRGYYRRRLGEVGLGAAEAEDLVQEALMAMNTGRHTYDLSEPLTPWVHAIARYKLVDHLRRSKVSLTHVGLEAAEDIVAVDDSSGAESAFGLVRLIACLPERMRRDPVGEDRNATGWSRPTRSSR